LAQTIKSKLERAAEICAERAEFEQGVIDHYAAYPEETPEGFASQRERTEARAFDRDSLIAGSKTLLILATYEDEARAFVASLLKRHAEAA
jgi:hypothetical protein